MAGNGGGGRVETNGQSSTEKPPGWPPPRPPGLFARGVRPRGDIGKLKNGGEGEKTNLWSSEAVELELGPQLQNPAKEKNSQAEREGDGVQPKTRRSVRRMGEKQREPRTGIARQ